MLLNTFLTGLKLLVCGTIGEHDSFTSIYLFLTTSEWRRWSGRANECRLEVMFWVMLMLS